LIDWEESEQDILARDAEDAEFLRQSITNRPDWLILEIYRKRAFGPLSTSVLLGEIDRRGLDINTPEPQYAVGILTTEGPHQITEWGLMQEQISTLRAGTEFVVLMVQVNGEVSTYKLV